MYGIVKWCYNIFYDYCYYKIFFYVFEFGKLFEFGKIIYFFLVNFFVILYKYCVNMDI